MDTLDVAVRHYRGESHERVAGRLRRKAKRAGWDFSPVVGMKQVSVGPLRSLIAIPGRLDQSVGRIWRVPMTS